MSPLQWGHRLSAMETRPWRKTCGGLEKLQWGHRLSAMETRAISLSRCSCWVLQWGHRLSAMETAIYADFRNSVYDVVQLLPHQSPESVSSTCLVAAHFQSCSCEAARGAREGPHYRTSRNAPLLLLHLTLPRQSCGGVRGRFPEQCSSHSPALRTAPCPQSRPGPL